MSLRFPLRQNHSFVEQVEIYVIFFCPYCIFVHPTTQECLPVCKLKTRVAFKWLQAQRNRTVNDWISAEAAEKLE